MTAKRYFLVHVFQRFFPFVNFIFRICFKKLFYLVEGKRILSFIYFLNKSYRGMLISVQSHPSEK